MADRFSRDYESDRSRWREDQGEGNRDWESEGGWARGRGENWGEFGGSTRRGWGGSMEYDPAQWSSRQPDTYSRGASQSQRGGRWYGSQQDQFGQGRGYRRQTYGQDYGQRSGMGRGGQAYQQRGRMGQGQDWQGQRTGQGYGQGYGQGGQWQPYGQSGQGYYADWLEDDTDLEYDDTPVTITYTEFWLVPGPFSGIGPDNYTRSPERLREDIIQRLTQHGQVNAANIQVEVNDNCEVTLTGQVDNRQAKREAEDVAESVWGVNDVHNQLKVRGREGRQGNQGDGTSGEQQSNPTTTRGQTGSRSKSG